MSFTRLIVDSVTEGHSLALASLAVLFLTSCEVVAPVDSAKNPSFRNSIPIRSVNYTERAREILAEEFQITGIDLQIDEKEAARQDGYSKNQIGFEEAFRRAIESFLYDPEDEESPLALGMHSVRELEGAQWANPPPPHHFAKGQEMIRQHLSRSDTVLRLVPVHWDESVHDRWKVYPAERNESPAEAWIFFLSIDSLSDHLYWAVVDRAVQKAPYNYGFN